MTRKRCFHLLWTTDIALGAPYRRGPIIHVWIATGPFGPSHAQGQPMPKPLRHVEAPAVAKSRPHLRQCFSNHTVGNPSHLEAQIAPKPSAAKLNPNPSPNGAQAWATPKPRPGQSSRRSPEHAQPQAKPHLNACIGRPQARSPGRKLLRLLRARRRSRSTGNGHGSIYAESPRKSVPPKKYTQK